MAENTLTHVGFICDGNRRWARAQGLPTIEGHKKGYEAVEMVVDELKDTEVKFVSFFLFSTENWDRTPEEVNYLMDLIAKRLDSLIKKAEKENLRIVVFGKPDPVDPKLWARLKNAEEVTAENTGLTVCVLFNYGGKWEIVEAAKRMAAAGDENYTPENFENYLYHPEIPACDMVVRTSGEERISGFHLWRAAYSEFYFIEKHFPALTPDDVADVVDEFHSRQRRFGK